MDDNPDNYPDIDILSIWEVPCIAHFCSLFRSSFGLLDFDIEEDHNRKNPFNRDVAFHSLPLRTKVQILYDLCDFRLDGDEVQEVLKSLESHSLRVTALGKDSGGSTYWYFYGTRLYREDYNNSPKSSPARKRGKRSTEVNDDRINPVNSKWQVVCFTEEDWQLLTRKFKNCKSKHEKSLHRTLTFDFLPELPRLFAEKEKLQRKRMMEQQLRRSSRNNVPSTGNLGKSASDEPSENQNSDDMTEDELKRKRLEQEKADRLLAEEMQREEKFLERIRITRRIASGQVPTGHLLTPTASADKNDIPDTKKLERKARILLRERRGGSASSGVSAKNSQSAASAKKSKRMTNNSMAACLPPVMKVDESDSPNVSPRRDSSRSPSPETPPSSTVTTTTTNNNNKVNKNSQPNHSSSSSSSVSKPKKKKLDEPLVSKEKEKEKEKQKDKNNKGSKSGVSKTKVKSSVIFAQNEEDVIIGMHKVIEAMKNHSDAWPFVNPVEEDYAPNYYAIIRNPMDLQAIEDKLDNQEYSSLEEFKGDFQKIVDNCRKYNGPSSEYTEMVETLHDAFNKSIQRYIIPDESDDEIFFFHKKENEPRKTKTPIAKTNSKIEKHNKKKRNQQRKQQLMRHHSRNSTAMDALTSATAETLKDINKWLGDAPKSSEYSSPSPCSVSSEVVLRDEKKVDDLRTKLKGVKRKSGKSHDRDDTSSSPPKKSNLTSNKSNSKDQVKMKRSKTRKEKSTIEKDSVREASRSRSNSDSKDQHHHHHRIHHKHRHHRPQKLPQNNTSQIREQSVSPERNKATTHVHRKESSSGGDKNKPRNSPHRNVTTVGKPVSHGGSNNNEKIKHTESKTSKSPAKRGGNSLIQGLKNSGTMKRLQLNKGTKYSSSINHHQDSKLKGGSSGNALGVYDFVTNSSYSSKSYMPNSDLSVGPATNSNSNNNSGARETTEKKKCLLINESSSNEGGPRLSLGSVLSADTIKLGDFKKDDVFSDEEDSVPCNKGDKAKTDKFDDLKAKVQSKIKSPSEADEDNNVKDDGDEVVKGETKKGGEEEDGDRKLEPSKGFNRDKCLPNLSAWIKAFGGPAKTATSNVTSTTPTKKSDSEQKSKFKVLGRVQVESSESKHSAKAASANSSKSKAEESNKTLSENQSSSHVNVGSDDVQPYDHPQHGTSNSSKRHRNRKMSSSSQSESGSPFPGNQDDQFGNRIVVNPPRWVDDHWGTHSQSQSPSASSHVSSQSPAGAEPFSPPMSSPPRTPQTPPWPVRVGFYQDITSQHSSPEKMTENVASPSTPPSVSGGATPPNLNSKNYGAYPSAQPYAEERLVGRYASSIPSPNIGSNLPSPSPGTNVDSPGNRSSLSISSVGSPHSPSLANTSNVHPSDYSRLSLTNANPSTSPGLHHSTGTPPQSGSQPGKPLQAMSPVLRSVSRSGSLNLNPGPPGLPVPYPVTSINSSGNFMMESNHHSHSPHPENAHIRHPQQPSPGPPLRYAHSLIPAHHHQPVTLSQSPGLPSSSSSATTVSLPYAQGHSGRQGLPPPTNSSSQPSPYPSNPYTSNPRSINVAPNVYSDPIGPESGRYYGPPPTSSSTKSRRNAAAAAHAVDIETSKNSPTVSSSAALESAKLSSELNVNGFQWPHNLASLSQIVNSIPNPMVAGMGVPTHGLPNAYRAHYDATVATTTPGMENMSKVFPRSEPSSYTNLSTSGKSSGGTTSTSQEKVHNITNEPPERRSSSKSESKSRSQGSKTSSQPIVPGSAFNFSALTPDLALYSKEMSDPSTLYSASPPSLAHHRPDLYPTSTANFHTSFAASAARTTAGGVPAASIAPYQIPPYYQPQSSQPFAHTQSPRGIDPYQPFFQGSPHVMGLLPPSGLPHPLIKYDEHPGSKHSEELRNGWIHPHHSLGFNRPGWI